MRKNIASMQITNNDDQNYEFENSLFFDCIVAVVGRFIATCIYSIVEEVLNELWYEWAWCWNGLTDSHRNRGFASLRTCASDKSSRNWEKKRDPGIYDVEASVQTRVFMREAKKTQNSTNYQKKFKSTANKKNIKSMAYKCTNDAQMTEIGKHRATFWFNNKQPILFFTCFLSFSVRQPKAGLQRAHEQQQKKKSMSP